MAKYAFTFGTYAKTPIGYKQYVSDVGKFVVDDCSLNGIADNTAENRMIFAIESIASTLHRAPCDVFIEAINDCPLENPTGLYGKLEVTL